MHFLNLFWFFSISGLCETTQTYGEHFNLLNLQPAETVSSILLTDERKLTSTKKNTLTHKKNYPTASI